LDGCGVLEIAADGTMHVLLAANHREAWPMPEHFIVSLLRKAYRTAPELPASPMPELFGEEEFALKHA
jgi:hypothetical protein